MEHKSNLCAGQRFWWPSVGTSSPLTWPKPHPTLATCLESWFHCSCCSCYYYYHSSDICMDVYLKKSHGFVYMWPLLVPIPISAGARSWCTRWPGQIEIELRTLKSLWPKRGECYIPVGHTALLAGQKGDVEWLTGDSWTAAKLSSSARRFPRWQVLWQLLCPRVLTSLYLMFFLYYFFLYPCSG